MGEIFDRRGSVAAANGTRRLSTAQLAHIQMASRTKDQKEPSLYAYVRSVMDSKTYTAILVIFIFYALFAEDMRVAFSPPDSDEVFYSLSLVCLIFFSAEIATCWVVLGDEYRYSFEFAVDVVALCR